jgi:hypothetical protein
LTRVAIHQPNYFPWLGYFAKIARSDVFVLLDDVDYQSGNATSVTNRTRIKTAAGPHRLTVPVVRDSGPGIAQVEIDHRRAWARKHLETLRFAYARSPHRAATLGLAEEVLGRRPSRLAALNADAISAVCGVLGLGTRIVASSTLAVASTDRNGRILEICARLDAAAYLSGAGGRKYNDPARFAEAGIALEYLDFAPPEYPQLHGPFVPNLGVLDALFNVGPDARRLLG